MATKTNMDGPTSELSLSPDSLEIYIEESANEYIDQLIARTAKLVQQQYCPTCNTFLNTNSSSSPKEECKQCDQLVDELVSQTVQKVKQEFCRTCSRPSTGAGVIYCFNDSYEFKDIIWFNIGEFSIDLALKKIDEYIKTWDYPDSWLYCIDYLKKDDLEFDMHYRFRVRWSLPTRRKPIPRATACVFFTFRVSKVKTKYHPVEVYFVIETNRLIHRPGKTRFREKWLKDVIESKVRLMEMINF